MGNNNSKKCACAFCADELTNACLDPSFCTSCSVDFIKCNKCKNSYSSKIKKCPHCGESNE